MIMWPADEDDEERCAQCGRTREQLQALQAGRGEGQHAGSGAGSSSSSSSSSSVGAGGALLLVNTNMRCTHLFCYRCAEQVFQFEKKKRMDCPRCGEEVLQHRLSARSLAEVEAERDAMMRKRVKAVYNRGEADFASLQEYNNYLEEVEDIVYNLVHEEQVEEMEAKLREYERAHKVAIARNRARLVQASKERMRQIRKEKGEDTSILQEMGQIIAPLGGAIGFGGVRGLAQQHQVTREQQQQSSGSVGGAAPDPLEAMLARQPEPPIPALGSAAAAPPPPPSSEVVSNEEIQRQKRRARRAMHMRRCQYEFAQGFAVS